MSATTTDVFRLLEETPCLEIEKHEFDLAPFQTLRRAVRSIILELHECGEPEALELSNMLRCALSEWLTNPVEFDATISDILDCLGPNDTIERRWGGDVQSKIDVARQAVSSLAEIPNPIREKIRESIRELESHGNSWRIYCHRKSKDYYPSMLPSGIVPVFMHSVRDFRESGAFEVLLKVGPLRSKGWGAIPDAILTAPRCRKLIQFVWAGSADEAEFGFDPVAKVGGGQATLPTQISWEQQTIRSGSNDEAGTLGNEVEFEDDFEVFARLNDTNRNRRAILCHIDDGHGVLLPPRSKVMSFTDAFASKEPVDHRIAGETLLEGMFLVWRLGNIDLGEIHADDGQFSRTWKARLADRLEENETELIECLRREGLELHLLPQALRRWCAPPAAVIPAPQQMGHFRILIRVLRLDNQDSTWFQHAWNEIRHSRGQAIQAGVHESEIIEEEALRILRKHVPELQGKAANGVGFPFRPPEEDGFSGAFMFYRIYFVEEGFLAPDSELKSVQELRVLETWRV